MEPARILFFDLCATGSVGKILQKVLESSPEISAQCFQEGMDAGSIHRTQACLLKLAPAFRPELVLFVLPPRMMINLDELLKPINKGVIVIQTAVIIESDDCRATMMIMPQEGTVHLTPEPLTAFNVLPAVWQMISRIHQGDELPLILDEVSKSRPLLGKNPGFLAEVQKIPMIAGCESSVLISGETGTGKEICAERIHLLSPRAKLPFVPVNCGAIPVELAENELFGHRRGAFTGAADSKAGLISEADGGTLFLDEIDSLPQLAQVKLLRFLQEKTYRPLGSIQELKAKARVIAATNSDVEEAVRSNRLRRDLYYRLNVLSMKLPPLRERREDIPLLAHHFLKKHAAWQSKGVVGLSPTVLKKLMLHDWPGNVREIEHAIERAVVLCTSHTIEDSDISLPQLEAGGREESFREAKRQCVEQFEREYLRKLLHSHGGNISKAAHAARKHRRAFWELIRKHEIDVERYR